MKLRLVAVVLLLVMALQAQGTLLYAFTTPAGERGWLLGTYHFGNARMATLAPSLLEKVRQADILRTEVAMDAAMLSLDPQWLMLPGGQTLVDVLPAETLQRFREEVAARAPDTPFFVFLRLRLWVAMVTFEALQLDEGELTQGVDFLVWNAAQTAGANLGGLETLQEQIESFDSIPLEDQILLLEETLAGAREARLNPDQPSPLDRVLDAYLSQDPAIIRELFLEVTPEHPEVRERMLEVLLTQRDKRMADRIAKLAASEPSATLFIAVGAAHLHPESGLPALLEARGFTLQPLQEELFAPAEAVEMPGSP